MAELQERRERQDALYADEPWAKLAVKAGFRPYDTEVPPALPSGFAPTNWTASPQRTPASAPSWN